MTEAVPPPVFLHGVDRDKYTFLLFLGMFAKLWKVTVSFLMSV
jgi:hypothetical protein